MDILLDDGIAFPVNLPVDRGFAVIDRESLTAKRFRRLSRLA
jgi:hypothetical protein